MKRIIYISLLMALLCGCESPLANTAVSQDEKITSFIESRYSENPVIFSNGVNRIVLEEGDSTCFAAKGNLVDFSYIAYQFTGSSLGNPYARGDMVATLGDGEMIEGLEYGMEGMCPGEKAYIVFSCKYGYKQSVAGVGSDQALLFEVFMNEIKQQ